MRIRLTLIGALVLFDLVVAALTSLGLISPQAAIGLLLTNPLAVIVDHQLRARRRVMGARPSRAWPDSRL
jgi:hypothetical protein